MVRAVHLQGRRCTVMAPDDLCARHTHIQQFSDRCRRGAGFGTESQRLCALLLQLKQGLMGHLQRGKGILCGHNDRAALPLHGVRQRFARRIGDGQAFQRIAVLLAAICGLLLIARQRDIVAVCIPAVNGRPRQQPLDDLLLAVRTNGCIVLARRRLDGHFALQC